MAIERTLAILKPDCVRKNLIGAVVKQIQEDGFHIISLKMVRLSKEGAEGFYDVHRGRPFFEGLTNFMSSGACIPIVLQKENAIADFRKLIGATDPAEAEHGTVRKLYADSKGENIIHGSDSVENAEIEISYFFPKSELVQIHA
jgi:nucleoside-diphosphate kinase